MRKTRVYLAGTSVLEGTTLERLLNVEGSCEVVGRLELQVGERPDICREQLDELAAEVRRLDPDVVVIGVQDAPALRSLHGLLAARLVLLTVRDSRATACAYAPESGGIVEISAEDLPALIVGELGGPG